MGVIQPLSQTIQPVRSPPSLKSSSSVLFAGKDVLHSTPDPVDPLNEGSLLASIPGPFPNDQAGTGGQNQMASSALTSGARSKVGSSTEHLQVLVTSRADPEKGVAP